MSKNIKFICWLLFVCMSTTIAFAASDARPEDFFTAHNVLHLVGWAFFPRIMFFFFSAISGGFFFWLGVVFFPRIMAAYWATVMYWDTNWLLCVIAWGFAFSGEAGEKYYIQKKTRK